MQNQKSEKRPHEDEELIAQAGGDPRLLNRLVALRITEEMLASDPDNPNHQQALKDMQEALDTYKRDKTEQ